MRKLFLLVGAAFGTLAGFLFAPRSGKETRNKISEDIKKGGKGLDLIKNDAKKIGKDIADTVKEISENEDVKKIVKKGKKQAEEIYKKGKKELETALKEGKKKINTEIKKGKKKLEKITEDAYSFGMKESKKLKKQPAKKVKKSSIKNKTVKTKTVKKSTTKNTKAKTKKS